jgi:protease-4
LPLRLFLVVAITLLNICSRAFATDVPLKAELQFPDIAAAAVTGSEGVVLNPAALFFNKQLGVQVYHSFAEGGLSGDNAFLISASGVGFGYQRLSLGLPSEVSRYDFAISSRILRNVYTGISYTYYKTDWAALDKVHSWNYSLMVHAGSAASFSAQAENINRQRFNDKKSDVGYLLSAAVRPLGDRLTFGGNLTTYSGQRLADARWRVSTKIYLRRGLALSGGYGDRREFGIGLEMQFGEGTVGAESFFDEHSGYSSSTTYTGYSVTPRAELINPRGKILQVDLSGEIPEERTSSFLFMRAPETVYQLLARIAAAKDDPEIRGLLLTVNSPEIGWGKLSDFRRVVNEFKGTGKKVVCYLGVSPNNGSYYLASAADEVYMLPVDALNLIGLRAEVTFYKGTLDKLGIEPQFEKIGEYKNYPNVFTDTTLTPPHREALEALLDDLYQQIVGEISGGRKISADDLKKIIDSGPFTSIQAESLGLVDGRFYPVELEERLPLLFQPGWTLLPSSLYLENPPYRERFGEAPKIALISVAGSITTGNSGSTIIDGSSAGSATISEAIRRARQDPSIKAIVMRLDTPGGDARAADLIWGELNRVREFKPVIVSMSDVCASGGYYIASASDEILLEPTTITGSIGVFTGKANLDGLYHKLGMRTETVTRGKHANMYSMKSGFSDEERAIVHRQVGDLYRNFVSIVAENRGLSEDSVDAIARGRVWSGKMALEIGLADREGNLLDAIAEAKKQAGIEGDDYEIIEMPSRGRSLFDIPSMVMTGVSRVFGFEGQANAGLLRLLQHLPADGVLQLRLPYQLIIE